MGFFRPRLSAVIVLLAASFFLASLFPFVDAQEPAGLLKPGDPGWLTAQGDSTSSNKGQGDSTSGNKGFDPATVSAGMAAFDRNCTSCHEAERALERSKDLAGWRTTVRRMANMRGANIPSEDLEPIAVYLASRTSGGAGLGGADAKSGMGTFSAFASLSPVWRGGRSTLQNPGFFPDTWVGASWQGKIFSARVTACASCHGVMEEAGLLSRVELVEAVVRVDLMEALGCNGCTCPAGMKASIEAGRFVVPFGAFSSQVNPGLYRAVSEPLIFNMGMRLDHHDLGHPVLPMPYSDEGVNLNLDVPIADLGTGPVTVTLDAYLVNGLSGIEAVEFDSTSRDLVDNNRRVAWGGRLSVGDPFVRAGASITQGRFNNPTGEEEFPTSLNYTIYGFDVQARYKDLVRVQAEYAKRRGDIVGDFEEGPLVLSETLDGYYVEAEVRPCEKFPVSFFARYDRMRRNSPLAPEESMVGLSSFNVTRYTWGFNIALWKQSLLILNHEYWVLPDPLPSQSVYGIRYAITF